MCDSIYDSYFLTVRLWYISVKAYFQYIFFSFNVHFRKMARRNPFVTEITVFLLPLIMDAEPFISVFIQNDNKIQGHWASDKGEL